MKSAPHFGVRCPPCGKVAAVPISPAQIDDDPVQILRSLSASDRQEIAAFWTSHETHGPDVVPCVMDIQPMEPMEQV